MFRMKVSASICYFNSRPSARGDSCTSISSVLFTISIHAPPRGATWTTMNSTLSAKYFNSRPSARGDGWAGACAPLPLAFQFTPLREGRPELASKLSDACKLFQFTPLREGRLPQEFSMRRAALISIHAPPRGATLRAHV